MRARLDADGKLAKKPDSPSASDGAVQVYSAGGRPGHARRLCRQHDAAALSAERHPARGRRRPRPGRPDGQRRPEPPLPPQNARTIGDTLSAKGVELGLVCGRLECGARRWHGSPPQREAQGHLHARRRRPNFQPHHQPFNYFARFAPGTADRAEHLKDGEDLLRDIDAGTLPQVAFYKPVGHLTRSIPPTPTSMSGDAHIADLLERLRQEPAMGATCWSS